MYASSAGLDSSHMHTSHELGKHLGRPEASLSALSVSLPLSVGDEIPESSVCTSSAGLGSSYMHTPHVLEKTVAGLPIF